MIKMYHIKKKKKRKRSKCMILNPPNNNKKTHYHLQLRQTISLKITLTPLKIFLTNPM